MKVQESKQSVAVFTDLSRAVATQFKAMASGARLYQVALTGQQLWDAYLAAFPSGSNPLYKTRTEHDCACCRHFVKQLGGVVAIQNGIVHTVWDLLNEPCEEDKLYPYSMVAYRMNYLIHSAAIENVWQTTERSIGTLRNFGQMADGTAVAFDHFHVEVPARYVAKKDNLGPSQAEARSTFDVMLRGLREITPDAMEAMMELSAQNQLYRGAEFTASVRAFHKLQQGYAKASNPELFVWENLSLNHRIRNTAIGTLLVDLSSGMDVEEAVGRWEKVMAPTNYRRSTALVTPKMVAKARETVEELGLTSALERRYATIEDITINDLLFADRTVKERLLKPDAFAAVEKQARTAKAIKVANNRQISVEHFLRDVLPTATSIEVLLDNKHAGNFVSLIAPVDPTARRLFTWDNNFSWSYTGDVADSIKQRVKAAGGNVTGDVRCSLSWFNYDDLDLHMVEAQPGSHIFFGDRKSYTTKGELDVDMNADGRISRTPVENITYPDRKYMPDGEYYLYVNQFSQRESKDHGFEVEIEFDGTVNTFAYDKNVRHGENVQVAIIKKAGDSLTLLPALPASTKSIEVWNMHTNQFVKVRAIMRSPNYWGQMVGNEHVFFMLDSCHNPDTARGFYNEFLRGDLVPHRKVLEMVGAKMHTELSDRQLSGLGFSLTKRDSLLVKVAGAVTQVMEVVF